ncbi:Uu.00g100630.m01.CDS01 [Anthostomella pinea]|uniref:Uu.00g100630.m01.CDS01 n=1 Tax=Anthostomella pinea TaxID=933095 RepID=A0AAI8YFG6_9PEZI|nr:Uu.00g100630.m01.CDS01 [Anthostomella pinea]
MNLLPETNAGVVTSWIPITTAHPDQAGCDGYKWRFVPDTIAAWDPGYGISVQTDATCLPKAVTTWWLADRLGLNTQTVLSVGPITCPEAYYTASVSAKDESSSLVACCPVDYDFVGKFYQAGDTGQCTSMYKQGDIATFAERDSSGAWHTTTSTCTADTTVAAIPVNGWKIAIPTSSSTGTSGDCPASTASLGEAAETASRGGNSTCATANQLGTGAAVGVGVGVSLGVTGLAMLAAGIFMMYRARKALSSQPVEERRGGGDTAGGPTKSETQVFATYYPESRESINLVDRPAHSPYETTVWSKSSSPNAYAPAHDPHAQAWIVPHGEMDGATSQNTYVPMPYKTYAPPSRDAGAYPPPLQDVQVTPSHETHVPQYQTAHVPPYQTAHVQSTTPQQELEGEYDRSVKVSLSTPWLTNSRPAPSSRFT